MRRFGRTLSVVASVVLLAGACTGGGSDGGSGGGSAGGSGEEPGEPVTLDLWIFEGEETFLPALESAFEDAHPNIDLKITEIPEDNYSTKIDTALAANSPPDIGFITEPRWIKAGRMLPLDDVIAAEGIDVSHLNQNAFAGCIYEEQIYCLGSYSAATMLFYNKELFDAAGLPYPSATESLTIDEYASLAEQLTQPSDDLATRVWGGEASTPYWWMDTRTHFSDDGRTTVGYVNDASTVHMYDVLTEMVADGYAPSEAQFQLIGTTEILATGQLAMSITDNASAIPLLENAGIDWGVAPLPVEGAGDEPFVSSWTDMWGVFSSSDNVDAAKQFVAFVGTTGNELRVELGNAVSLDLTLAEELGWAEESAGRREALDVMALAHPTIFVPGYWDVTDPLWDSFALVVEGDLTAQEALDEVAPEMQESLDQAWQTWEDI
jgi:multiple sugar transport system substrate-binding protein